jgi:hypothetical protein
MPEPKQTHTPCQKPPWGCTLLSSSGARILSHEAQSANGNKNVTSPRSCPLRPNTSERSTSGRYLGHTQSVKQFLFRLKNLKLHRGSDLQSQHPIQTNAKQGSKEAKGMHTPLNRNYSKYDAKLALVCPRKHPQHNDFITATALKQWTSTPRPHSCFAHQPVATNSLIKRRSYVAVVPGLAGDHVVPILAAVVEHAGPADKGALTQQPAQVIAAFPPFAGTGSCRVVFETGQQKMMTGSRVTLKNWKIAHGFRS